MANYSLLTDGAMHGQHLQLFGPFPQLLEHCSHNLHSSPQYLIHPSRVHRASVFYLSDYLLLVLLLTIYISSCWLKWDIPSPWTCQTHNYMSMAALWQKAME